MAEYMEGKIQDRFDYYHDLERDNEALRHDIARHVETTSELASANEALRARIRELEGRLETDHAYELSDDGSLVRRELSEDERSTFPDAVACRDETIDIQNAKLIEFRDRISALEEALKPFANSVFNDNGDMTINLRFAETDDYARAYFAMRGATQKSGETDG